MSDSSKHRRAILARRALYLSTALVTMGCPSSPETTSDSPSSDPVDAKTSRSKSRRKKKTAQVAPEAPWKEVMDRAPPLDVPKGLSDRERGRFVGVVASYERKYEAVRKVWERTPGCDPSAHACKDWRDLSEDAKQMYRALDGFSLGSCGGADGSTASVHARSRVHGAYLSSLVVRLEAHLQQVAVAHGPSGTDAWALMLKKAKEPPPRPCLSPCPMPLVEDITVSIAFAKDDATLDESQTKVKSALQSALSRQRIQGARATLVVRGHVDPGEAKGKALADARARAVAKWLLDNGVPAAEVSTKSLGAAVLIEQSAGPSAGAENRRVDFEVIPR